VVRSGPLAAGEAGGRINDIKRAGADSVERGGGLRNARLTSERFSQTRDHRF
jgi:hypothetical protein